MDTASIPLQRKLFLNRPLSSVVVMSGHPRAGLQVHQNVPYLCGGLLRPLESTTPCTDERIIIANRFFIA